MCPQIPTSPHRIVCSIAWCVDSWFHGLALEVANRETGATGKSKRTCRRTAAAFTRVVLEYEREKPSSQPRAAEPRLLHSRIPIPMCRGIIAKHLPSICSPLSANRVPYTNRRQRRDWGTWNCESCVVKSTKCDVYNSFLCMVSIPASDQVQQRRHHLRLPYVFISLSVGRCRGLVACCLVVMVMLFDVLHFGDEWETRRHMSRHWA